MAAAAEKPRTTFDLFLSQLEDDLQKLRDDGQPIRSLRQFKNVAKQSYRCASEYARKPAKPQETKVLRCDHGGFLVAMPDGSVKVDSQNPYGDWEKFVVVELDDGRVAIRSDHGRYLAAKPDGTVLADVEGLESELAPEARFEHQRHASGGALFATHEGKYLIAMPDGFLRADSANPEGTWEQFEITPLNKDNILNRKELFEFLDKLSEDKLCFTALTYVVNQWNMGGVVRLKHHSCILAGGDKFLKFDFGRWGVGWNLCDTFPDLPKGTCVNETFEIDADPLSVKNYCLEVKDFSWLNNNCSSFAFGLMQHLQVTKPSKMPDPWPTWSRCLATPPVKVPTRRRPTAGREATPGVGATVTPAEEAVAIAHAATSPTAEDNSQEAEAVHKVLSGDSRHTDFTCAPACVSMDDLPEVPSEGVAKVPSARVGPLRARSFSRTRSISDASTITKISL